MGYRNVSAALALAVALAAAAPAQAATSYPDGGSDFAVDAEGWIGSDASCSCGVVLVCTASNEYEPGAGNPPGSLTMRVDATVNPGGTFEGSSGGPSRPARSTRCSGALTRARKSGKVGADP